MISIPFKIYRLIFLTLGILLLVEIGLEIRAHERGWNTILGRLLDKLPSTGKGEPTPAHFGPSKDFPFRSLIKPFEKNPKIKRIWIASSSYAQDNYLNASKIFPNLLGVQLNQSGFPVQILNAAQEGQSIVGNVKVLKEIAAPWKPDYILLYQMNLDISELSQPNSKHDAHDGPAAPLKQKSSLAEQYFEKTTIYQLLKENLTARLSQSRILTSDIGEDARVVFRQRINDFLNISRSIGATPILCTFATSHDLHHQNDIPASVKDFMLRYNIYLSVSGWFKAIDQFNDDIRQIGKEQNIMVIDLNHYLSGDPKFFRDFVHFNPQGHKMMAQVIAEKLLEKYPPEP